MDVKRITAEAARLSTNTNSEDQRTNILIACINADMARKNTVTIANAIERHTDTMRLIAKIIARI